VGFFSRAGEETRRGKICGVGFSLTTPPMVAGVDEVCLAGRGICSGVDEVCQGGRYEVVVCGDEEEEAA